MTESPRRSAAILPVLEELREIIGADSAVLWCSAGQEFRPQLVSTADGRALRRNPRTDGMVRWAAEQRTTHGADDSEGATFIAAPVTRGEALSGVLSVYAERGTALSRDASRRWVTRFAARIATLEGLLTSRSAAERAERQTAVLLDAAHQLKSRRTLGPLAEAVCDAAIGMTGASRAALVHWNPDQQSGKVVYATRSHVVESEAPVSLASETGVACSSDFPLVLSHAARRRVPVRVYNELEPSRPVEALAILPLRGRDGVLGALVIEGDSADAIRLEDGRNLGLLALLAAASLETVWEFEEMSRRARTDPLTGLGNRQQFEERLRQIVLETDRFGGTCALVLGDIDHFKRVNDEHGHQAGDQVLRAVADVFTRTIRVVDSCARYGGEELALFLPQTGLDGARELAERLRTRIAEQPLIIGSRRVSVTISFGVATYPDVAHTREDLFESADRALYTAKREGRNRVAVSGVSPTAPEISAAPLK